MNNIIFPMVGSFLGFFLGLISLVLKDRLDLNKRAELFKVTTLFFADNLRKYLHDNSDLHPGIDIKIINNCLDGVRSEDLFEIYQKLFTVYSDWYRGCYLATGLKVKDIDATRNELNEIINSLKRYKSHSIWHFWK